MKLRDLSAGELRIALRSGLCIQMGEYVARVRSPMAAVSDGLGFLYADFPVVHDAFADFPVDIVPRRRLRGRLHAEAAFLFDGFEPFLPMPRPHAFPFLEWALNWCVSNHVLDRLVLHAAAVESGGRALVLPGSPGSGKSTLCAALVARGWRLLSDEFALAALGQATLIPLPRPVSLKNASIGIVRRLAPEAALSPVVHDTHKGAVCHMRPPSEAVRRMHDTAETAWLVFPRFLAGAETTLRGRPDVQTFAALVDNAFNYGSLGEAGFQTVGALVRAAPGWDLTFGDLDEACTTLERLARPSIASDAAAE